MKYILIMTSSEFGTEEFEYATRSEREAGFKRIQSKIKKLNDKINREFTFIER